MSNCDNCESCAQNVPIFSKLDQTELKKIDQLIYQQSYKAGEIIYLAGEIGKNIYIINSGQVKIYQSSEQGKEYILRFLEERDFFGEIVLFQEEQLASNAQAITDCTLCVISKRDLEKLVKSSPDLAHQLLTALSKRLKKAERQLQSLALQNAREKTIRFLINLAQEKSLSQQQVTKVKLPFNRQGVADFLAMTPETLSRKLSELQDEGLISIVGQKEVIIKSKNLLNEASN